MNIIQVLRQYNLKSMERRGINLRRPHTSATAARANGFPAAIAAVPADAGTNLSSMMTPVSAPEHVTAETLDCFFVAAQFFRSFLPEGEKDGNDFNVPLKLGNIPDYLAEMFDAGNT